MTPKLIFIRHGEAEHNVAFHRDGESAFENPLYKDAHLTQKGKEQVQASAKKLFDLKILDIWSSPLTRCIQTSDELFEELNVNNLYLHDNLLERQGGNHVCNYRKEKEELKKDHRHYNFNFLPELPCFWIERENQTSLYMRMLSFVLLLASLYKDRKEDTYLLIVAHNDCISSLTGTSLQNAEYIITSVDEILASKDKND
jgi:broad specificity phosphatase PhoE